MALLLAKKVTILAKYLDFANIFLEKLANIFLKQIEVNEYAIKLQKGKKSPYKPISNLRPVKFGTLKTYIEINLVNGFI